ncbi:MAG: peptidyl-prolyl cis-trans isomerase [Acidobacteriota bacterium]|nr:peptidyl-prolyl cis-trans isomerase [Acidobacteriota bacterium]
MKNIKLIATILLVLLCIQCGKDTQAPGAKKNTGTGELMETTGDDNIILSIDNEKFTNKQFKEFIKSRYPDFSFKDINVRLASRIFDMFIEHKTVMHSVEQANIKMDQSEIDNYLKETTLPTDLQNNPSLTESAKARKYLYFKLYKDIDVTDAEIRQYYDRHIDDYRKSTEVFLYQIVVNDKARAYEIHETLSKSPEKFEELAKRYSISIEAKDGGSMGYFEKGTLPKDMEDVVFALGLNTISPVVDSPYGFHIFKVTKIKKERLQFLEAVKNEIKNKLLSEKLGVAYEDFLAGLKSELNINAKYQSLFFPYQAIKGEQNVETNQNIDDANNTGTGADAGPNNH